MFIYYTTIIITFITSYLAQTIRKKNRIDCDMEYNNLFVVLTGCILILVAGFRWNVGTDYWQYSINYKKYISTLWEDVRSFREPGINIIAKVSSLIYDDYSTMFLLASLITVGLIIQTIAKNSNMFSFSVLLYIFVGIWQGSFNGVRQYLACAILFAGHKYIIQREFTKYFIFTLIASMFHQSAIVMILLYFVPVKKIKTKHLIMLMFLSVAILYSYDIIFDVLEKIKETEFRSYGYMTRNVNIMRVLIAFAPLIVYFFTTNKSQLTNKQFFYINMLFVNAAITAATSSSAYLMRFAIYTNIYLILGIPTLYNFGDRYLRFIMKFITAILFFLFWYIEVKSSPSLNNYMWIFSR